MRLFPKRRWLSFSLRSLLVAVTIFCVWLGWQVSIVRERKALLRTVHLAGGIADNYEEAMPGFMVEQPAPPLAWPRVALGDATFLRIGYPCMSQADRQAVMAAFPEAVLVREPTATTLAWYRGDRSTTERESRTPR